MLVSAWRCRLPMVPSRSLGAEGGNINFLHAYLGGLSAGMASPTAPL